MVVSSGFLFVWAFVVWRERLAEAKVTAGNRFRSLCVSNSNPLGVDTLKLVWAFASGCLPPHAAMWYASKCPVGGSCAKRSEKQAACWSFVSEDTCVWKLYLFQNVSHMP